MMRDHEIENRKSTENEKEVKGRGVVRIWLLYNDNRTRKL